MRTLDQRKGQLRELRKSGSYVKLIATLLEMRMSPLDDFEKAFSEAYLMKLANLQIPVEMNHKKEEKEEEVADPFA